MPKIAIIDYDAGNLASVKKALDYLGIENSVTSDPSELRKSDGLILPGVGAFPDAMDSLLKRGLVPVLREQAEKKPFLGICLGMQLLFSKGYEFRECEGLDLIPGEVRRIPDTGLKIPHMGWNDLILRNDCPLLAGVPDGTYVYFVHSFRGLPDNRAHLAAVTEYGAELAAVVSRGSVFGAQFHPEKSGEPGLLMLQNFAKFL